MGIVQEKDYGSEKKMVYEARRRVDERRGKKISKFREYEKQLWKEVNNVMRVREQVSKVISGTNEEMLEGNDAMR